MTLATICGAASERVVYAQNLTRSLSERAEIGEDMPKHAPPSFCRDTPFSGRIGIVISAPEGSTRVAGGKREARSPR